MELAYLNAIKIFLPSAIAFLVGIAITPTCSRLFYRYKLWRKVGRGESTNDDFRAVVAQDALETSTPRVGGIIIWASVLLTIGLIYALFILFPNAVTDKLEFISRSQTYIPIATLFIGSFIGLLDDLVQIHTPLRLRNDPVFMRYLKLALIAVLSLGIAWWCNTKLGMDSIHIPFDGELALGALFIPFFVLISLGVFSTSVVDGIDGLAGGLLGAIFAAFAFIAYAHTMIDLAAFCGVVAGATLAFLWFNIPPARFYMGETGMMGLTLTIATISFLTDTVLLLPIIAFPLFLTSLSVILQFLSKKLRGKRLFRLAPLHHHFEAKGWPREKITMRFWIIGIMGAIIGTLISLVS